MTKPKKANLLWMDLEMTGLDPIKDRILEVAVVATDWDLKEAATYEAVVKVGPRLAEKRMTGAFWDKYAAVRAELLKQNQEQGRSGRTIENELLEFIETNFDPKKPVYLAGNSIHQDRKFIDREWPRLAARLHYRMLDVSALKVLFAEKYGEAVKKPEHHRALDDIRGSIEELGHYIGFIKVKK